MCGINGIFFYDAERRVPADIVRRMADRQQHRGPDDGGIWIDGSIGLGFRRLSIIDEAGGHQPMLNESSTVCLVFNGEIYNFRDLRVELEGLGWRFGTRSDTEVLLRAWEQWGEECVRRLRGMFAFVLWDKRRRILFGARDRLGIKPLYYHAGPRSFAFASELKALIEYPEVPRELDVTALYEYLNHRYVIAPRTMLRGIAKLPPGHSFVVSDSGLSITRYWQFANVEYTGRVNERRLIEEFTATMDEAIRLHLVSDVPVGAFLSGGLDSSAVVAWMAKSQSSRVKTFSIGYDAPESELEFAKVVAQHLGTEHHEVVLGPDDFASSFADVVWAMDEPVGDEAALPLHYLSALARSEVTVALSGEGADELLAGYDYSRQVEIERFRSWPGSNWVGRAGRRAGIKPIVSRAHLLTTPLEKRYRGVSQPFNWPEMQELFPDFPVNDIQLPEMQGIDLAYAACPVEDPLGRMTYVDLTTWLPDDLLVKADRMTMAHSLELRVPFLDHKVVEFLWRVPPGFKIRGVVKKYLLKQAVAGLLPSEIVNRKKVGFATPLDSWFRSSLSEFVDDSLTQRGGALDFLDRKVVRSLLSRHKHEDLSRQIYPLLVLDRWSRQYLTSPVAACA